MFLHNAEWFIKIGKGFTLHKSCNALCVRDRREKHAKRREIFIGEAKL